MEAVKISVLEAATIPDKLAVVEKKASSTSSLYIGSTITSPNIHSIVRVVALYLSPKISADPKVGADITSNNNFCYFSEEKYTVENPEAFEEERKDHIYTAPDTSAIEEFISALYDCAQFRFAPI